MSEEFEVTIPDKATDPAGYIAYLEAKLAEVTNLGEAGGIAWCYVSKMSPDDTGKMRKVEFNVTGRGLTTESAIKNLVGGIRYAKTLGMHPWKVDEYSQPSPAPQQPQPPATGAAPALPRAGAPQAPVTQAPAQPAAAGVGGGVIYIDKVEVTPKPGGKSEVGFYGVGHKYPDVRITKTFSELSAMFTGVTGAAWTEQHFAVAEVYPLTLNVTWVPSTNLNKDGNPYKNLAKIENA